MGVILRDIFKHGINGRAFTQLYAGAVSASVCSVVIGAFYYYSFCMAKRMANKALGVSDATRPAATSAVSEHSQHTSTPTPLPAHDMHHSAMLAGMCFDDHAQQQQQQPGGTDDAALTPGCQAHAAPAVSSAPDAAVGLSTATAVAMTEEQLRERKVKANVLAAVAAALVGALIEAPVELFRHRTQVRRASSS